MNLDTIENWHNFKRRFARPPNIRTARRKVQAGIWPGLDDGEDVWIYPLRFDLGLRAPDATDALALQLLDG